MNVVQVPIHVCASDFVSIRAPKYAIYVSVDLLYMYCWSNLCFIYKQSEAISIALPTKNLSTSDLNKCWSLWFIKFSLMHCLHDQTRLIGFFCNNVSCGS